MTAGPLIEDCRIEVIGDDFINIHGHFARVLYQENPTTLIVTQMNNQFDVGEALLPLTIDFFQRESMEPLGTRRVLSAKISQWTPERENTIADLDHRWHSGNAASARYGRKIYVHRIILDEPVDFAIGSDVIVACEDFSTPDTIIRNNHFVGSLARGMLLHSPRVLVEDNTIENICSSGIVLTSEGSYWGEGTYVRDATVRNNTIQNVGIGDRGGDGIIIIQPNPDRFKIQHDIRLENNIIEEVGGSGIRAVGVRDLAIESNTIMQYGNRPFGYEAEEGGQPGEKFGISLDYIENLQLLDNQIIQPGEWAQGDIWEPNIEGAVSKDTLK